MAERAYEKLGKWMRMVDWLPMYVRKVGRGRENCPAEVRLTDMYLKKVGRENCPAEVRHTDMF